MTQEDEGRDVIPFFKVQGKDFSFEMDKLTHTEKAVLEKDNLVMAILDTIDDGVMTIDSNMRITSFNRAAERITGFSVGEALGQQCKDIFCGKGSIESGRCRVECTMKMAAKELKPVTVKKRIVNKKGDLVMTSLTATILYDLSDRPVGGMETFIDITAFEKLKDGCEGKKYILGNIIGKNHKIMEIYELIDSISDSRANVLIQGESGTGKGLVAKAIHCSSINQKGPFVHVNCAALPENLLESELFGHVRGAFTGAVSDRQGRLEFAQNGTIFLDEIGELSPGMQAKLLKVTEEKQFERVGGSKTIHADVRIISASNRDLQKAVKNNTFREDLYYRLNVIPVFTPPLRERMDDLPFLIEHFLEKFNVKMNKQIRGASTKGMDVFLKYPWPGNVRELENVLEYAVIHCKGEIIDVQHLPDSIKLPDKVEKGATQVQTNPGLKRGRSKMLDLDALRKALDDCRWDRLETARQVNMSRTTLWRMMKKYGLLN
ncbi:MAG: sigma 54-interacting transcriptional regulator [Syntrophales bacterium]|jgi:PAS domain S-box-containing protein|nr:sigma 54-interacting transcriptional regulator [Syntrophales bacterium]